MSRPVITGLLLLISANVLSQVSGIKSGLAVSTQGIEKLYLEILSPPDDIIDGWEFLPYDYRSKTTPFLSEGRSFYADILMHNRYYRNIPVQYDTFQDELVFTDTSRMISARYPKIILRKEVVDSFCLNTPEGLLSFSKLSFDENDQMKDGYYEIAYSGPTKLFVKHTSLIYRRDAINEYDYSPQYYINFNNTWVPVRNHKEFIALFGRDSEHIKNFIKQNSFKIRRMYKNDLVRILRYFDSSPSLKSSDI